MGGTTADTNAAKGTPTTEDWPSNLLSGSLRHILGIGMLSLTLVAIPGLSVLLYKSQRKALPDMNQTTNPSPLAPAIHRARLDRLAIFEVSESELETLERGSPSSLFLNLAIFVVSVAISFSISLATTTINSDRTHAVFVIVTVIGYLAAFTFFLLWWKTYSSAKSVAQQIRNRLPPEGVPAGSPLDTEE